MVQLRLSIWLVFFTFACLFSLQVRGAVAMIVDSYEAASSHGGAAPQRVNFSDTFAATPLVFVLTTNQGSSGHAAYIRVFDVDTTGFSSMITEPGSFDGLHDVMPNVTFVAISQNGVEFSDGTTIRVGSLNTHRGQGAAGLFTNTSYESVAFGSPFATTPAIITGLQSIANVADPGLGQHDALSIRQPFLALAMDNVTVNGFDLALERLETGSGNVEFYNGAEMLDETVGWMAVEQGQGQFEGEGGQSILYDFSVSPSAVDGWDVGGENISFVQNFTDNGVLAVAQTNSRNGDNGGFIRRGTVNANTIRLYVDEDTVLDTERDHIDETASVLAFSEGFVVIPEPRVCLLVTFTLAFCAWYRRR